MGLFGFGKKKNKADKAEAKVEDEDVKAAKAANAAAKADSELAQHTAAAALPEAASDYEGRGDERGPWDVNDENVPDTHIINVPKSGMYTVDVQNGILYEQERLNIKYSFIY